MRKCDKVKGKYNCYIDNGDWRTKNVRYRFYRLLHEALRESHNNYWTSSKRYKRKAVINNTLYIPVVELLVQFDKPHNTMIYLGGSCMIPYECIKDIRIF